MKLKKRQQIGVLGILRKDNKLLLLKRSSKAKYEAGNWGFLGEGVKFGEDPEHALIRGFKEEIGIRVKVKKFLCIISDTWKSKVVNEEKHLVLLCYICEPIPKSKISLKKMLRLGEIEDFKWIKSPKDVKKMNLIKNTRKIMNLALRDK
jgi:ADP-ribose pyrophosphatase YjhB (NUDIX family)